MIDRPYKRTYRPSLNHETNGYDSDDKFASNGMQYIQNFKLIQQDLIRLFDYIHPCNANQDTFSMRIHELYIRACIEVEANFVAILRENNYSRVGNWNIKDFKKVNATHLLSKYQIKAPHWFEKEVRFTPFHDWEGGDSLFWYQAYNKIKHNKYEDFSSANLYNLMNAVSANLILLSSQFYIHELGNLWSMYIEGGEDTAKMGIGNYFHITFPKFPPEMRYNFNWEDMKGDSSPFQNLTFV